MHLRHRADIKTLAWAFGLMPGLCILTFAVPRLAGWLFPLSAYAAFSAAVIAHNHNHCPTFLERRYNALFSTWISLFYGFPTYGWIPTHNENHHRFRGADGDATVRAHVGQRDSFRLAATSFFRSTRTQGPLLASYRARVRRRSTSAWLRIWTDYGVVYGAHAGACIVAVVLYGPLRGLFVYASGLGAPAFFALWAIMLTNWVQHVGCDPASRFGHSRNFVAPWFNALVFQNGFHTVHHERPGLHWSALPEAHARMAARIPDALNASSPFRYMLETYVGPLRGIM
jgi:fatty acid desaturase